MGTFEKIKSAVNRHPEQRSRAARGASSKDPLKNALRSNAQGFRTIVLKVLIVLVALLFAAVPPLFINDAIGYVGLFAVVFVVLVSFVYLQLLKRAFSFSETSLQATCERGTEMEFAVTFKNAGPLVFTRIEPHFYVTDLFGEMGSVTPASMMLMPFEESQYHFTARFPHIGTYNAGVYKIVVTDLLGLFTYTVKNENRHSVVVVPHMFEVGRVEIETNVMRESVRMFQPIVTDDQDYAGTRDYAMGDPLKTVHWKLSSRNPEGELYTRIFETMATPGLTTIVDPFAPNYDSESLMQVFDGLVESALSVDDYARKKGIETQFVYLDKHQVTVQKQFSGVDAASSLVDGMLRISPEGGAVDSRLGLEMLRQYGHSLYSHGNIAFCTSRLAEEVVESLVEIKMRKRNPLLFLCVPSSLDGKQREEFLRPLRRLVQAQIVYYIVESNEEGTKVSA